MAARGNRSGVVPVGVAFFATVAAALGLVQSAFAQEAPPPPPPAESTSTSTEPTTAPPPPADSPPADTNPTDPPPDATPPDPAPTTTEPPAQSSSTEPAAEQPAEASVTETTTTTPAETKPAAGSTTDSADAANAVKLEVAAPAATTAPAAPAASAPAATPTSGAPSGATIVLVATQPAAAVAAENSATASSAASPAGSAAEDAEAVAQDDAISLRPRSVAAVRFDAAPARRPAERAAALPVTVSPNSRIARQTCIRPHGLVPLSQKCRVVVRTRLAPATLAYAVAPTPEVRAAIDRGAAQAAASRARAAPPPKSKAAKERPLPKIRPILPFGGVALGALHDGFGGVAGSASSSRIFALATVPLRVPRPFTLARLRLPSTTVHGALAAPPPTRPG